MTLERLFADLAMSSFLIFIGVVWMHATRNRWRIVDPPESLWWIDSQALLKKLMGSKFAAGLSYLTGFAFVVVGTVGLILRLLELGRRMGYWT